MRDAVLTDWLGQTPWANWTRKPLCGDASARRYERLSGQSGETVILMDAPIETCGAQRPFVEITRHLQGLDLTVPDILCWDEGHGFLILSDLGQTDFALHLTARPEDEFELYSAATDILKRIHSAPAPVGLSEMTPKIGAEMIEIAFDRAANDHSKNLRTDVEQELHDLLETVDPSPQILSLRDFHAENLMWRAGKTGTNRVGLLDFQDAFITHPTYDLASLLRDARRDVSSELLEPLLKQLSPEGDFDQFKLAFHVMAVQRNLRILGVFHRLAEDSGKIRYLDFLPRVKSHLETDLAAAGLERLKPLAHRAFLEHRK